MISTIRIKKKNLFKGGLHVRQLDETLEHEIAQV